MIDIQDLQEVVRNAFNRTFGVKTEVDMESKINRKETETDAYTIDVKDTWVWVEGYKGTDRDMRCREFQYELGALYQMPRESVDECITGYHLCLTLRDVFEYYPIGNGNRFFKVRALVRLHDKNEYGKYPHNDSSIYTITYPFRQPRNKLASAEIEFLEELTMDEILKDTKARDWDDTYKKMALEVGVDNAEVEMETTTLMGFGYSKPFSHYIIKQGRYETAAAVGSQPDLSMDMKALMILKM